MNKYEKISVEMRKRIKDGYYRMDQPIPDEISLTKEFDCSRMTMKRALDILVAEGLLFRKRGHGTFIVQSKAADEKINVISEESLGLSKLLSNSTITSEIIAFDVQFSDAIVAGHLGISENTPVYHLIRLRKVDGNPYVMERTYMPVSLIPGIDEEILHSSIYRYIQQTLRLTVAGAHRKIRADKPNDLDITYLECKVDDPILEVEQIGYLNNGIPFEYSFSRHRYDKFVFSTVTIRK
jgi:GntR family transcriptional regulator